MLLKHMLACCKRLWLCAMSNCIAPGVGRTQRQQACDRDHNLLLPPQGGVLPSEPEPTQSSMLMYHHVCRIDPLQQTLDFLFGAEGELSAVLEQAVYM
jgi:hypothetical protein